MNNNPLFQLLLFFTLFVGLYKTKEYNQAITIPVPIQANTTSENKQNTDNSIWWLLSVIADDDSSNHEHKDESHHCFSFERIRRRPYGFSIRCACVRMLLAVIHLSLLLLLLCQFLHRCIG